MVCVCVCVLWFESILDASGSVLEGDYDDFVCEKVHLSISEGSIKLCIDGSECMYVMIGITLVVWDNICGVCMCMCFVA